MGDVKSWTTISSNVIGDLRDFIMKRMGSESSKLGTESPANLGFIASPNIGISFHRNRNTDMADCGRVSLTNFWSHASKMSVRLAEITRVMTCPMFSDGPMAVGPWVPKDTPIVTETPSSTHMNFIRHCSWGVICFDARCKSSSGARFVFLPHQWGLVPSTSNSTSFRSGIHHVHSNKIYPNISSQMQSDAVAFKIHFLPSPCWIRPNGVIVHGETCRCLGSSIRIYHFRPEFEDRTWWHDTFFLKYQHTFRKLTIFNLPKSRCHGHTWELEVDVGKPFGFRAFPNERIQWAG